MDVTTDEMIALTEPERVAMVEAARMAKIARFGFDQPPTIAEQLEVMTAQRDALAATLERVRSRLGELDLDSGRVTAPGTAWGSILREALALASAPPVSRPLPDREALAAIETAPVVSDDTEWEYTVGFVNHDGRVIAQDPEDTTESLVEARGWVEDYIETGTFDNAIVVGKPMVSPWVAIEKGGEQCDAITTVAGDPWRGCGLPTGHVEGHEYSRQIHKAYPEYGIPKGADSDV